MSKKILIVSDSHGNYVRLDKIVQKEAPFDYLIHCGDGVQDLLHINVPDRTGVIKVAGNVDAHRVYNMDELDYGEIDNLRFIVVHGHRYHVKNDYNLLIGEGIHHGVDIVFFGHTHLQMYNKGKPALFNPGPAMHGCYGVVVTGESGGYYLRKIDE